MTRAHDPSASSPRRRRSPQPAKRLDAIHQPGEHDAIAKVKLECTADCVVGGFR